MKYIKTYENFTLNSNEEEVNEGLKSMAAGALVALATILPNTSLAQKAKELDIKPNKQEMTLAQKMKRDLEKQAHTVEVDTLINVQPGDSISTYFDDDLRLVDLQQGIQKKYFNEKGEFLGKSYDFDTKYKDGKSINYSSVEDTIRSTGNDLSGNFYGDPSRYYGAAEKIKLLASKLNNKINSYFNQFNSLSQEKQEELHQEISGDIKNINRISPTSYPDLNSNFEDMVSKIKSGEFAGTDLPKFNIEDSWNKN
jgi:hypothetical protein